MNRRRGRWRLALACSVAAAPLCGAGSEALAADAAAPSDVPLSGAALSNVALSAPSLSGAAATPSPAGAIVAHPELFTADDLLLLEVDADGWQLSDGLGAYSSRAGTFLPLGELARLFDLEITVDPQRQRAEGWVGAPDRTVSVDAVTRTLRVGMTVRSLSIAEVAFRDGDIYLRDDVIEALLPVKLKLDKASLILNVTPTAALPFQQRIERERRRSGLGAAPGAARPVLTVRTPYDLFSPPAADITLNADGGNRAPKAEGRYELRTAGDLLYGDVQTYVGSDSDGRVSDVRLLYERKDAGGRALGPLGLTRFDLGDTFTPSMQLGARSVGGRGMAFTTAPLEQQSVFGKTDLRGELPLGYEVELYVNEVLRGSQSQAVQGRYAFTNVELAYGLNVIRLVFYGPHGERREEVSRVNVGGGQAPRGKAYVTFGAVQESTPIFDPRAVGTPVTSGQGDLRLTGQLLYGLTDKTSLDLEFARYTPQPNDPRTLAMAGVATSLGAFATQFDVARDNTGAGALALGVAGRWRGVSIVLRERAYSGDFVDELEPAGLAGPMRDSTDLTADFTARLGRLQLPATVLLQHVDMADGGDVTNVNLRVSKPIGRYLLSSTLGYQAVEPQGGTGAHQAVGEVDMAGIVDGAWQVRGGVGYSIGQGLHVDSVQVTAARQIGPRAAVQLGVQHAFGAASTTGLTASNTWRLDFADLSFTGAYDTRTKAVRVGLQLTFGLAFNPARGDYRMVGPGASAGGAVAFEAYKDLNGDGRREAGEPGVPGVVIEGGARPAHTDAQGRAFVSGLTDGVATQLRINTDDVQDAYLLSPPNVVALTPRAGRSVIVGYPMTVAGEAQLRIVFRQGSAPPKGLSALSLQVVSAAGEVAAEGRTEYDGTWLVSGLKPGAYSLRIEPGQAARLHMGLAHPVNLVISGAGGYVGQFVDEAVLLRPANPDGDGAAPGPASQPASPPPAVQPAPAEAHGAPAPAATVRPHAALRHEPLLHRLHRHHRRRRHHHAQILRHSLGAPPRHVPTTASPAP